MGYEIQYERPFKEKVKIAFASICGIFMFLVICFILWHIPFIKNYFMELYNDNTIIQLLVNFIVAIIDGVLSIFK